MKSQPDSTGEAGLELALDSKGGAGLVSACFAAVF